MTRKTIKSATLDGKQVTVSGDASVPVVNNSWEPMDNLDDTVDYKYNPSKENTTIPIALDEETRKVVESVSRYTGWTANLFFRDKTSAQVSSAALVNVPSLDGEGVVEVEIHGVVRWL